MAQTTTDPIKPDPAATPPATTTETADLTAATTDPTAISSQISAAAAVASSATAEQQEEENNNNPPDDTSPSHRSYMRVKVGSTEYNSTKGQVLAGSYVWLHTDRFSEAVILLDDPEGGILAGLSKQSDVEVELGFLGGAKRNKFVGKIYRYGRRGSDTAVIHAADPTVKFGQNQLSTVTSAGDVPPDDKNQKTTPASDQFLQELDQLDQLMAPSSDLDNAAALLNLSEEAKVLGASDSKAAAAKVAEMQSIASQLDPEKTPGAADQLPMLLGSLQTSAQAPVPPTTNSTGFSSALEQVAAADTATGASPSGTPQPKATLAEQFLLKSNSDLSFATDGTFVPLDSGQVSPQMSEMTAMISQAAEQGKIVFARGKTLHVADPGRGESSGLVLDYDGNRPVFLSRPEVLKRTPLQLQSGYGAIFVQGYNMDQKQAVTAAVSVTGPPTPHPTGNIKVPEWGDVKLADPIYQGCLYTWGDATREGERVPESQAVMEGIVAIAQVMMNLCGKYNNGQRFEVVTSWYRDPATNIAVSSSGANGPHTTGTAVDFYNPNMDQMYDDLNASWENGVAIKPGQFIHVDLVPGGRRRWNY